MKTVPNVADVYGHQVRTQPLGITHVARCTCRWESIPDVELEVVESRARFHLATIASSAKAHRDAEARRRALFALAQGESLAQADRHIARCRKCGTQTWEGDCPTCLHLKLSISRRGQGHHARLTKGVAA